MCKDMSLRLKTSSLKDRVLRTKINYIVGNISGNQGKNNKKKVNKGPKVK